MKTKNLLENTRSFFIGTCSHPHTLTLRKEWWFLHLQKQKHALKKSLLQNFSLFLQFSCVSYGLIFLKLMKKQEGGDHTWTIMPSRYVDAIPPFASCTWADNRWGITHVGGTGCAYFIRLLWGFNRCWLLLLNLDPHLFIIFKMKACQATLGDSPGLRKGPGATRDGIAAE